MTTSTCSLASTSTTSTASYRFVLLTLVLNKGLERLELLKREGIVSLGYKHSSSTSA